MSLYVASIASGSNGNCYYVGNETEAVLIDAGISCREIERRMKRMGLSLQKVKAVFVSHEHSDHIRGLEVLVKKHFLPVYITPPTLRQARLQPVTRILSFRPNDTITLGRLEITPFSKQHDAVDPYSFVVSCDGARVGVFTDIGAPCAQVTYHFGRCDAVFLEANYDEEMLEQGSYPFHLKRRIRSSHGHLSNHQALQLFMQHRSAHLSHLFLSHLSQNNNCPQKAGDLFRNHCGPVQIVVASRHEESGVYAIHAKGKTAALRTNAAQMELDLF